MKLSTPTVCIYIHVEDPDQNPNAFQEPHVDLAPFKDPFEDPIQDPFGGLLKQVTIEKVT